MSLENIKEKSGILTWSEENIKNTPESIGVFILRSSPINGAIIYIETSLNLKKDLLKNFNENIFSNVNFFDWYTTNTIEEASAFKSEWKTKYNI